MNSIISKAALEARRARYKPGCRVELVSMNDPHTNLKPGDRGRVEFIDDIGTAHIAWDNGSTLGAAYGDVIKLAPPELTDTILEQILSIRASGAVNMFDSKTVQLLAIQRDFFDLADFIEADAIAYAAFILTGKRCQSDENRS